MKGAVTIGEYLIQRLYGLGVRHVFGIPGDYVLGFFDQLSRSKLRIINTCDEQGAGFAADAYARMQGLGAVCVTYGVGGLKVANTTGRRMPRYRRSWSSAARLGSGSSEDQPLLHHKVRDLRYPAESVRPADRCVDRPG